MKSLGKIKRRMQRLSAWSLSLLVMVALMQMSLVYGSGDVARRYRIAVTLFNEGEYEAAGTRFGDVIQAGDLNDRGDAAYIVNSYYGRASCGIEQGRKDKADSKFSEALERYDKAYQDLSVFRSKFEELQETLRSDALYDEMEKHFVTISDQMVQLAGEAGDICAKSGKYDTAIQWYDKGLTYISSQNPVYGDVLYAKSDAVFQLGKYEDALDLLAEFEDELVNHSKASNALLLAGDVHRIIAERKNDRIHLEEALDAYSKVVAQHPAGADVELVKTAMLAKARTQKALGRMEQAVVDFKNVQVYYPDTTYEVEAALELGDYSFLAKRYEEAVKYFDRAVEVGKSLNMPYFSAISYHWIGWSYYKEAVQLETEGAPGMERRIQNLYEKSVDAFKDSIGESEKFWKAEGRETQKAKQLEEYYGESLFRIGRGYQGLKKWDNAIRTFEKIPQTYKEWWLRGIAEIAVSKERNGDVEGSLAKWDELKSQLSLENVPNVELDLLMRRGESIFDLQRFAEAEKAYREIIAKYPNSPDDAAARVNLGLSLFKQGKDQEAIQTFTALLDKHGGNNNLSVSIGSALFWRGYLTARIGAGEDSALNLRRAIDDYRQLISRFPRHESADDAQLEIGFCTYSLGAFDPGKYSEAIAEYSKVLQNYPESEYSDDALFEIGRCYRLVGDESREEESLRRLVRDYATGEWADDALLRIAEIHSDRAQKTDNRAERLIAQDTYTEIISSFPGTGSEVIAHFQLGSMSYKFDDDLQIAAMEFEKCAQVAEQLLDKTVAGEYAPVDLGIAAIGDLLLRSTFWQGESLFQMAVESEDAAQPVNLVKEAYSRARTVYQRLLARGTRLRNDFPNAIPNLYEIMGGANMDIPIVGEAYYMSSRCLYKEGDMEGAKAGLQTIKAPEKLRLKAEQLLASIAYEQGDLVNARAMVERWLSNSAAQEMADEYSVAVQVLQAKIALASGDVSEAKALSLDTWALFSSVNGLWEESAYIVAKCYQQEKDVEKAKTWFEKLQGSTVERWRVVARGALTQLGSD